MSEAPQLMSAEDKLDEALKQTFPASDAFWLPSQPATPAVAPSRALSPSASGAGLPER